MYVWGRWIVGVAGSNPADGMDFRLVFDVWCVGSGLCDQLMTRSEYSRTARARVCVCVCV
jgi:hypothetical protein